MGSKDSGKFLLKSNFAIDHKWEPFYTGGHVVAYDKGKYLLCTCGDAVKVIDVDTGLVKHSLSQDGDDVTCVAVSPDDVVIVTATRSLLLKQWNLGENIECVRTWKAIHSAPICCLTFDSTSTLLASGSSDSTIKVWDVIRQYCTHNLRGSNGVVNIVKFHPTELKLFSSSNDYAIRVWDLLTSRCVCLLGGHVSAVTSLVFISKKNLQSPQMLVSGGRDAVLLLWDLNKTQNNSNVEASKTIPVFENIEGVLQLPDSHLSDLISDEQSSLAPHVVTAGNKGNLLVWNLESGKCVSSKDHPNHEISYLLNLGDNYAAVTSDHNINIYIPRNGFTLDKHLVGYNDEILDAKFYGESDSHIVVASNSDQIRVFNRLTSACQLLTGHQDTVLSLDTFSDNLTFASASKDNTIRIWSIDAHTSVISCMAIGRGHTHGVMTLACARLTSNFLVSGSQDQTFKVWSIPSSSDSSEEPISLKVTLSVKAHEKDINSVTVSPNDKLIATGSQDKTAKLWNISDGTLVGVFRGHKRGIWCVQFSPMDQVLGSSSADGTIKIWALSDHTCLKTFEGHDCSVLKMIFISRGSQLMTSGSDGLLKLWNVKNSECVRSFDGHDGKVWGLCVNSSDTIVLSGASDSKIIQWKDVTLQEKEEEKIASETLVLRQQNLNNLIHEKKFTKALSLAITLDRPFTALKVIKEIMWEEAGDKVLDETICKLRHDQKNTMLKFISTWNTNSRNCHEAQRVLNTIIRSTHPQDLMEFADIESVTESLLPYTERHFQRISKIYQQATFVDYVWQLMKLKPVCIPQLGEGDNDTVADVFYIDDQLSTQSRDETDESIAESENEKTNENDINIKHVEQLIENLEESQAEPDLVSPPKKMRLRSSKSSKGITGIQKGIKKTMKQRN